MLNLELQICEQCKAISELEDTVKKQGNTLAQLQSIIIAQSKEINEMKVELEATCDEVSFSNDFGILYPNAFKFANYMLSISLMMIMRIAHHFTLVQEVTSCVFRCVLMDLKKERAPIYQCMLTSCVEIMMIIFPGLSLELLK